MPKTTSTSPWSTKSSLAARALLWVGQERTVETFQGFLAMLGTKLSSHIQFVCSDMWEPLYLRIRENCSQALHIIDRFTL
jgi:transposase